MGIGGHVINSKLLSTDELRRVLKNAMGQGAPWHEVDLIKDHITALEATIENLRGQVDSARQGGATDAFNIAQSVLNAILFDKGDHSGQSAIDLVLAIRTIETKRNEFK